MKGRAGDGTVTRVSRPVRTYRRIHTPISPAPSSTRPSGMVQKDWADPVPSYAEQGWGRGPRAAGREHHQGKPGWDICPGRMLTRRPQG